MSETSQRIAADTGEEAQALSSISSTIGDMVDTLKAINAQTQAVHDAISQASNSNAAASQELLNRGLGAAPPA